MRSIRSLFDLPQPHEIRLLLADLPPDERERLWRNAELATRRGGRYWTGLFVSSCFMFAVLVAPDTSRLRLRDVALMLLAGLIGMFVAERIRRRDLRHYLETELVKMGRCPKCGYDVRATPGGCPECGSSIESGGVSHPHKSLKDCDGGHSAAE